MAHSLVDTFNEDFKTRYNKYLSNIGDNKLIHPTFSEIFNIDSLVDIKHVTEFNKLFENLKYIKDSLPTIIDINNDQRDCDNAEYNRKLLYSVDQLHNLLYVITNVPKVIIDIICSYSYETKLAMCYIIKHNEGNYAYINDDTFYEIESNIIYIKNLSTKTMESKILSDLDKNISRYFVLCKKNYLKFYGIVKSQHAHKKYKIEIILLFTINTTTYEIMKNNSLNKLSFVIEQNISNAIFDNNNIYLFLKNKKHVGAYQIINVVKREISKHISLNDSLVIKQLAENKERITDVIIKVKNNFIYIIYVIDRLFLIIRIYNMNTNSYTYYFEIPHYNLPRNSRRIYLTECFVINNKLHIGITYETKKIKKYYMLLVFNIHTNTIDNKYVLKHFEKSSCFDVDFNKSGSLDDSIVYKTKKNIIVYDYICC